jgi:hypothetical protein
VRGKGVNRAAGAHGALLGRRGYLSRAREDGEDDGKLANEST